jgi:lysophospholipase L1-like esterase
LFPVLALAGWVGVRSLAAETRPTQAQWEPEIRAFESGDRAKPPALNGVLFIGSSSIRMWTNLAQSFPGHQVLNRGFGGSQISDSTAFVERIVLPYRPKLVVLYAGDNDIASGKSPERVLADYKDFVEKVRAGLPGTPIAFVSIKPCPARERFLPQVIRANDLIKSYGDSHSNLLFVDVFSAMVGPNARAPADLFLADGLHPNARCYALWASILRPVLDRYDPH